MLIKKIYSLAPVLYVFTMSANAFDDNFTGLGITANAAQMKALSKHSCKASLIVPGVTVITQNTFSTDGLGKYTAGYQTQSFNIDGNPPFTCAYTLDLTKISKYVTGADGRGFAFHYWTPVANTTQNPGLHAIPGLCDTPWRSQIAAVSSFTGTTTITLKNIKATHFIDTNFNLYNNNKAFPVDIYCD